MASKTLVKQRINVPLILFIKTNHMKTSVIFDDAPEQSKSSYSAFGLIFLGTEHGEEHRLSFV